MGATDVPCPIGVNHDLYPVQEQSLFVLFSSAISNLVKSIHMIQSAILLTVGFLKVLTKNELASSKDINELFQSFQLSPAILDPSQNPSLFRSTLVVIAKVCTNVMPLPKLLRAKAPATGCNGLKSK